MDRTQQLLAKARMGDITEQERIELQDVLYGLAPSSEEYQNISSVLGISSLPEVEDPSAAPPRRAAMLPQYEGGEDLGDPGSGFGGPTLDFLNPINDRVQPFFDSVATGYHNARGEGDDGLPLYQGGEPMNAAEVSDTQGSAPIGSNTHVDEFDPKNFKALAGGGGLTANSGLGYDTLPEYELPDIDVNQFPEGYSFSGGNEASVDILSSHPELWTRQQANRAGTPNMAAFMEPRVNASLNMATMGLLGDDINNTLGGGSTTPTGRLAASEDFMKQFDAEGVQFVDPADIWNQAFERANNTRFESMVSPQTGQLMTPEEIITATHDALLTSMGFANPETESWANSLLNNAAQEYMLALANGDTDLSYPAYLEQMGLSNLLG
jgi:hypothetical protein